MTISYPVSLPSSPANFSAAKFGINWNTSLHMSPLSRVQQSLERPGALWQAEFVVPPLLLAADAAAWKGFLVSLRGRHGTFRAGDPSYSGPRGSAGGAPLVNGASQTGRALITDGWSAAATFKIGDQFQLGDYLYMMVEDVTADGSGNATLVFDPPLRSSPADNLALTISAPKGIWRLASDEEGMWDAQVGPVWGFSFKAHEALT